MIHCLALRAIMRMEMGKLDERRHIRKLTIEMFIIIITEALIGDYSTLKSNCR